MQYLRGIFQGDSLSPVLLQKTLFRISVIIKEWRGDMAGDSNHRRHKINHLFHIGDLNLFAGDEIGLQKVINTVCRFSRDVDVLLRLQKYAPFQSQSLCVNF